MIDNLPRATERTCLCTECEQTRLEKLRVALADAGYPFAPSEVVVLRRVFEQVA